MNGNSKTNLKVRLAGAAKRVRAKLGWPAAVGAGLVLAVGVTFALVHTHRLHLPSPTAGLKRFMNDREAGRRLDEGHALYAQGKLGAALKAYDRALTQDPSAGDDKLFANLVATYGHPEQGDAASVIVRHKVVKTTPGLEKLAHSTNGRVRWGAVQTLERLGTAHRSDFVAAYIEDLDSPECQVRKRAVEELGKEGDRHALAALHAAQEKDQKTKQGGFLGMFPTTCLGDGAAQAEKRILAHK